MRWKICRRVVKKWELGVFWDICQYWNPAGDEILILASSRIFRFLSDLIRWLDIWGNSRKWNQQACNLDSQIVPKYLSNRILKKKRRFVTRVQKQHIILQRKQVNSEANILQKKSSAMLSTYDHLVSSIQSYSLSGT